MERLRGIAQFVWLAILLSTPVLVAPMAFPLLPLAAGLTFAAPFVLPAPYCWKALTRMSLLIFLLAAGFTVAYQPGAPVELFEDGQMLAPAETYAAGGHPYIDTYPLHGWGADGGIDALVFRFFGRRLGVFWLRRAAATGLALAALGWACFQLFASVRWAAAALLCALGICPFLSERHLLVLVALGLLARAARTDRGSDWLLAGIASAATLFWTLDFGVIALGGGLVTALALPLASSERSLRLWARPALRFLAGAGAGGLPFLLWLSRERAVTAFFRVSFVEVPRTVTDTWGLPAGSVDKLLQAGLARFPYLLLLEDGTLYFLLLAVLGSATSLFLLRASARALDPVDRGAAPVIAIACFALRGALGRADAGHFALYGVFAGLPAAWILYRASRARRYAGLLSAAVGLLLLARLHLPRIIGFEAEAITGASHARAAAVSPRGRLPAAEPQSGELSALRRSFDAQLAPGETFFDFANEPALYFLLGRTPPTRFSCVPLYEEEGKQREVVAALERVRPPLAILAGGSYRDAFDGVSNRERAPLVAAYLDARYEPIGKVSGRTIGRRRVP